MTTLTPDERQRLLRAKIEIDGREAVDASLARTLAGHLGAVWQRDMQGLGRVLTLDQMPPDEQGRLVRIARDTIKKLREGE